MSKKNLQSEGPEWESGYETGFRRGYKQAIKDALLTTQSILVANGIYMDDKEFYLEYDNLTEEGQIVPPKEA